MVTPYFTQHSPPAFVAMLPPMLQNVKDAGSGGYQRSCSPAASLTSTLNAPGCVTAVRVTGSIVMSRMRSSERTIPPSMAVEPPDRLVPAPRGTTVRRRGVADDGLDVLVDVARTTAAGVPAFGSSARSRR